MKEGINPKYREDLIVELRNAQANGLKVEIAPEEGREGPDPTRYGDWENKGIAIDF